MLDTIDWVIIGAYLLLSLYIGYRYKNQAGKSLSDFFLGGRNMPWFVAGISMVATTFAADTPLWVTEVIAQHGISGELALVEYAYRWNAYYFLLCQAVEKGRYSYRVRVY